jgi:hypothetical protein
MIEKRWAANEEAPLTRDQQIEQLMKTAKERHDARIERFKQIKDNEWVKT